MSGMAMIDARCSKCKSAIGWYGTMANMPACRSCGHRPPQEELDAAAAKMAETCRLLDLAPHKASGDELRRQRILAGLTLRQAGKKMGIAPSQLSRWEMGVEKPDERQAQAIANVYGPKDAA